MARPAAPRSTTSPKTAATRACPDSLCCFFTTASPLRTFDKDCVAPLDNTGLAKLPLFHRRCLEERHERTVFGDKNTSKIEATGNALTRNPVALHPRRRKLEERL